MKPNAWLTDQNFLDKVIFENKYYFNSLCLYITNYVKNIPIPVSVTWDYKHNQIYFSIGKEKFKFLVDVNIAYADFITLVNRELKRFFPQYEIEVKKNYPLTNSEILKKVKDEGIKLDDAILLTKDVIEKEVGVIEIVFFLQDSFIININGRKFLMMTGNVNTPLPISEFLKILRGIKSSEEKRNYIFNNSREIEDKTKQAKIENINYLGFQMKNFIEINYPDLMLYDFVKVDSRKWKWGNYIINFELNILENDCLLFLKDKGVKIIV